MRRAQISPARRPVKAANSTSSPKGGRPSRRIRARGLLDQRSSMAAASARTWAAVRNNISGEAAEGSSTPAQGFERILPSLMAKSSTILSTKKAFRTVPGRRPLASSERTKASTSA